MSVQFRNNQLFMHKKQPPVQYTAHQLKCQASTADFVEVKTACVCSGKSALDDSSVYTKCHCVDELMYYFRVVQMTHLLRIKYFFTSGLFSGSVELCLQPL